MENEKVGEEELDMANMPIGDDVPQVEPKTVRVESYEIRSVPMDDKIYKKLCLVVKHPDMKDTIEVSQVKWLNKDDKLKVSGLWIKRDKDNKLPYQSAVATMLRFFNVSVIKEIEGKELPTVLDERGYLAVKAY